MMNVLKFDLVEKIIFQTVLVLITIGLTSFFNERSQKRKEKRHCPTLQIYNLCKTSAKDSYLSKLLKSDFKYLMVPISSSDDICDRQLEYILTFSNITNDEVKNFVDKTDCVALCFLNQIPESCLNIDKIYTKNGTMQYIVDDTALSALHNEEGVCIICDIEDAPIKFSGSFKNYGITYNIRQAETEQIKPELHKKQSRSKKC